MAIYNQSYDANSYITKGYQLPRQEILGAISAKTNYYIQSAEQIKNAYDTTFDFNLSNEANKNSLRAQQQQIDEQMKGLVKKDLTISDNSTAIKNLFKPVMQNSNYIADEQLTSRIHSGFADAQSDLKKKGSDHYNIKSIQVLNNTLQDWKNDDPANIDRYTSDTLGTTYQPYDPKIDKDFEKTIADRVKNGKIKVDIKDGQGNIVTQESVDMNSLQAQEYIRSIRPQQQVVQDQLEAKLFSNSLRKASPQEQQQLIDHVSALQTYNISKQVGYIEAEKHKVESSFALMPKEEQEKVKGTYKKAIAGYDEDVQKAKSMYDGFDHKAYFDDNKRNIAQNQLETILNQRSVNGVVDGMGLNQVSRSIKTDTSFWNARNLEYNREKLASENAFKQADLQLKSARLQLDAAKEANKATKGTKPGEVGYENPNIQAASAVASIGTAGMTDEEKLEVAGKDVQTRLKGEIEAKKTETGTELFNQLKVTVSDPNGIGNTDFMSALDKVPSNSPIGDLMDSLTGASDTNKKLITSLINEGAKKISGGKLFKESTIPTLKAFESKMYIKAALEDPQIFQAAIKKAGADTGDFAAADYLGYKKSQLDYDIKTQEQKYGRIYKNTAQAFIPNAQGKSFEELKHYNEDQYVRDIAPQLQSLGFNSKDINDFGRYLKGEKIDNPKVFVTDHSYLGMGVYNNVSILGSALEKYKNNWTAYQKTLNTNLAKVPSGGTNYNTTTYAIVDKTEEDKSFNPDVHFNRANFQTILNNNVTGANLKGDSVDPGKLEKIKSLINSDANAINGFSPYSDGKENFLTLKLNITPENTKVIKSFDLDPNDLTNLKIYVDNSAIQRLGFKPQSDATSGLQHGKIFGSKLHSGNEFSFYNSGTPNQLNINYEGSLLVPAIDQTTGQFALKQSSVERFVKTPQKGMKGNFDEAVKKGRADEVAPYIYQTDAEAKRIADVLDKYKIDHSQEKALIFAQLPQKVKEELRANTISFKNIRD